MQIEVLGITQSGMRGVDAARKHGPSLMCRFVIFVRQQMATQHAAGNTLAGGAGTWTCWGEQCLVGGLMHAVRCSARCGGPVGLSRRAEAADQLVAVERRCTHSMHARHAPVRAHAHATAAPRTNHHHMRTAVPRRYVEYQRKQRMVLRYHKDALMAMASFWRILDTSSVSFTSLSKALNAIEKSVTQAS